MGLVNKLSILMAKIGCAGLRNASEQNKDNVDYVKAVVKSQGPRSFQFASDWIRSDASTILEIVSFSPEVIRFAKTPIMDRFCIDMYVEEKEVDYLMFALKCVEADHNAILYFEKDLQNKVIEVLKSKSSFVGEFSGKTCTIKIDNLTSNEELIDILDYLEIEKKCY